MDDGEEEQEVFFGPVTGAELKARERLNQLLADISSAQTTNTNTCLDEAGESCNDSIRLDDDSAEEEEFFTPAVAVRASHKILCVSESSSDDSFESIRSPSNGGSPCGSIHELDGMHSVVSTQNKCFPLQVGLAEEARDEVISESDEENSLGNSDKNLQNVSDFEHTVVSENSEVDSKNSSVSTVGEENQNEQEINSYRRNDECLINTTEALVSPENSCRRVSLHKVNSGNFCLPEAAGDEIVSQVIRDQNSSKAILEENFTHESSPNRLNSVKEHASSTRDKVSLEGCIKAMGCLDLSNTPSVRSRGRIGTNSISQQVSQHAEDLCKDVECERVISEQKQDCSISLDGEIAPINDLEESQAIYIDSHMVENSSVVYQLLPDSVVAGCMSEDTNEVVGEREANDDHPMNDLKEENSLGAVEDKGSDFKSIDHTENADCALANRDKYVTANHIEKGNEIFNVKELTKATSMLEVLNQPNISKDKLLGEFAGGFFHKSESDKSSDVDGTVKQECNEVKHDIAKSNSIQHYNNKLLNNIGQNGPDDYLYLKELNDELNSAGEKQNEFLTRKDGVEALEHEIDLKMNQDCVKSGGNDSYIEELENELKSLKFSEDPEVESAATSDDSLRSQKEHANNFKKEAAYLAFKTDTEYFNETKESTSACTQSSCLLGKSIVFDAQELEGEVNRAESVNCNALTLEQNTNSLSTLSIEKLESDNIHVYIKETHLQSDEKAISDTTESKLLEESPCCSTSLDELKGSLNTLQHDGLVLTKCEKTYMDATGREYASSECISEGDIELVDNKCLNVSKEALNNQEGLASQQLKETSKSSNITNADVLNNSKLHAPTVLKTDILIASPGESKAKDPNGQSMFLEDYSFSSSFESLERKINKEFAKKENLNENCKEFIVENSEENVSDCNKLTSKPLDDITPCKIDYGTRISNFKSSSCQRSGSMNLLEFACWNSQTFSSALASHEKDPARNSHVTLRQSPTKKNLSQRSVDLDISDIMNECLPMSEALNKLEVDEIGKVETKHVKKRLSFGLEEKCLSEEILSNSFLNSNDFESSFLQISRLSATKTKGSVHQGSPLIEALDLQSPLANVVEEEHAVPITFASSKTPVKTESLMKSTKKHNDITEVLPSKLETPKVTDRIAVEQRSDCKIKSADPCRVLSRKSTLKSTPASKARPVGASRISMSCPKIKPVDQLKFLSKPVTRREQEVVETSSVGQQASSKSCSKLKFGDSAKFHSRQAILKPTSPLKTPSSVAKKTPSQSCLKGEAAKTSSVKVQVVTPNLKKVASKENIPLKAKEIGRFGFKSGVGASSAPRHIPKLTPKKYESIQSPVGQYIQENPPPPLVQIVRAQCKIPAIPVSGTKRTGIHHANTVTDAVMVEGGKSVLPPAKYCSKPGILRNIPKLAAKKPVLKLKNSPCPVVTKHIGSSRVMKGHTYLKGEESFIGAGRPSEIHSKSITDMEMSVIQQVKLVHSNTIAAKKNGI